MLMTLHNNFAVFTHVVVRGSNSHDIKREEYEAPQPSKRLSLMKPNKISPVFFFFFHSMIFFFQVDKFHQDQQSLSLNNGTSATPVVAEVQPVSQ